MTYKLGALNGLFFFTIFVQHHSVYKIQNHTLSFISILFISFHSLTGCFQQFARSAKAKDWNAYPRESTEELAENWTQLYKMLVTNYHKVNIVLSVTRDLSSQVLNRTRCLTRDHLTWSSPVWTRMRRKTGREKCKWNALGKDLATQTSPFSRSIISQLERQMRVDPKNSILMT